MTAGGDTGIMMMMSVIPAAGAIIAIVALWFYQLDEETVTNMSAELAKRRAREPHSDAAFPLQPVSPLMAAATRLTPASGFDDTVIPESDAGQISRPAPSSGISTPAP